jgi:hypothetical protein
LGHRAVTTDFTDFHGFFGERRFAGAALRLGGDQNRPCPFEASFFGPGLFWSRRLCRLAKHFFSVKCLVLSVKREGQEASPSTGSGRRNAGGGGEGFGVWMGLFTIDYRLHTIFGMVENGGGFCLTGGGGFGMINGTTWVGSAGRVIGM